MNMSIINLMHPYNYLQRGGRAFLLVCLCYSMYNKIVVSYDARCPVPLPNINIIYTPTLVLALVLRHR